MTAYLVVYEMGPESWGAHVPELPVCVAVGDSRREVEELIEGAIEMYIDVMREEGRPVPAPAGRGVVVGA